jgi:hypothetical protein
MIYRHPHSLTATTKQQLKDPIAGFGTVQDYAVRATFDQSYTTLKAVEQSLPAGPASRS